MEIRKLIREVIAQQQAQPAAQPQAKAVLQQKVAQMDAATIANLQKITAQLPQILSKIANTTGDKDGELDAPGAPAQGQAQPAQPAPQPAQAGAGAAAAQTAAMPKRRQQQPTTAIAAGKEPTRSTVE